jgi:predicted nucleic acid-binding protein
MTEMRFVDTNILLYAISGDPDEAGKAETANVILGRNELCLSVQVLQEFYVQATRQNKANPLTHDEAVRYIQSWRRFPVTSITPDLVERALDSKKRWKLSYWDAAIIESARDAGCREVLSEDLNDRQSYAGVRVVNPFV